MCELPLYILKWNDLVADQKKTLILYYDKHHDILKCLRYLECDTEKETLLVSELQLLLIID